MSETAHCQACLKYSPEGLLHCSFGVCFMPSPELRSRIKTQFESMSVPYYIARVDFSRGGNIARAQWQYDHWKAQDAKRSTTKKNHDSIVLRWQNDEKYRASQTTGQKSIVVTWTNSQLLTYHMSQHGNSVQDMKTVACWESMMDHFWVTDKTR